MVHVDPAVMGYSSWGHGNTKAGSIIQLELDVRQPPAGVLLRHQLQWSLWDHPWMASSLAERTAGKHSHRQLGRDGKTERQERHYEN